MAETGKAEACPRCRGRMIVDAAAGDSACFNCGHVAYTSAPLPLVRKSERKPSHGGTSLA